MGLRCIDDLEVIRRFATVFVQRPERTAPLQSASRFSQIYLNQSEGRSLFQPALLSPFALASCFSTNRDNRI
jgi:hypothetical protein